MRRPKPVRSLNTLEHVLATESAVVRGFARAAADRLDLGPITLADRDRLLKRGERLGIRRFDANLILAAVEHRHRESNPMAGPPTMRLTPPAGVATRVPARPPVWQAAAAAVALQGVILTGAWWLLA